MNSPQNLSRGKLHRLPDDILPIPKRGEPRLFRSSMVFRFVTVNKVIIMYPPCLGYYLCPFQTLKITDNARPFFQWRIKLFDNGQICFINNTICR
jgi:hypothetical protein